MRTGNRSNDSTRSGLCRDLLTTIWLGRSARETISAGRTTGDRNRTPGPHDDQETICFVLLRRYGAANRPACRSSLKG